jgi:hypothetical protein
MNITKKTIYTHLFRNTADQFLTLKGIRFCPGTPGCRALERQRRKPRDSGVMRSLQSLSGILRNSVSEKYARNCVSQELTGSQLNMNLFLPIHLKKKHPGDQNEKRLIFKDLILFLTRRRIS